MEALSIIIGLSNLFVGGLLLALALPLIRGKVKMNHFYGVRFKKSFESEENWYKINRYGGRLLVYWSIVIMGIGLLCFVAPFSAGGALFWVFTLAPLLVIIPAIQSYRYAQRL